MGSPTNGQLSRKKATVILAAILLLAGWLRVWGLDYGIPHYLARPDEEMIVGRALTIFATGDWHPGTLLYPSLVIYLTTAAIETYYVIGKVTGHYDVHRDLVFEIALVHPGLQFWICRWVSVLAGLGGVAAIYALGVTAFHRRSIGLIAAAFLAVNPIHVRDSHFATVDITMTFFVVLALVFAVSAARATRRPSYLDFALAGLFAGLATSAKYNAGLVALSIAVAAWIARRDAKLGWGAAAKTLVSAGVVAALGFGLTSPYVLLHFRGFLAGANRLGTLLYGSKADLALWGHLGSTLPRGLGWPLFLAALWGIARVFWKRDPSGLVILSFLIPFFALVSSVRYTLPRYVLPIIPLLAVLAAEAVGNGVERWTRARARPAAAAVGIVLVAGLMAPGLWNALGFDRLAAAVDTRVQAAEWIAENVTPRTKIVVCKGYGAPVINEDRRRPPAFIVEEKDCFRASTEVSADARFLVTHEHRQLTFYSRVDPKLRAWLEENAEPVAVFDPYRKTSGEEPFFHTSDAFYLPFTGFGALERGGPLVTIWELAPHGQ